MNGTHCRHRCCEKNNFHRLGAARNRCGDGLAPSGGTGADKKPATADGKRLTFGVLDELAAGSTAVYVAELEGTNPGPARVQVDVRSDDLTQPLREEQATRVAK